MKQHLDAGIIFTEEQVKLMFVSGIYKHFDIEPMPSMLDIAVKYDREDIIERIQNKVYTSETLIAAIGSFNQFDTVIQHVSPDQSHLLEACQQQKVAIINKLVNYKLILNEDCFTAMFLTGNYYCGEDGVECFIQNGFELTLKHVKQLTLRRIYIKDIHRFNFKFDDEFYSICAMNGFYPYNVKYTIDSLKEACFRENVNLCNDIIHSGVIPDIECMQIACRTINIDLIVLLSSYITPDRKCVQLVHCKLYRNPNSIKLLKFMKQFHPDI